MTSEVQTQYGPIGSKISLDSIHLPCSARVRYLALAMPLNLKIPALGKLNATNSRERGTKEH